MDTTFQTAPTIPMRPSDVEALRKRMRCLEIQRRVTLGALGSFVLFVGVIVGTAL